LFHRGIKFFVAHRFNGGLDMNNAPSIRLSNHWSKKSPNHKHQTFSLSFVFLLHFFVLIQRNEAKKNQGKPDRSARFAWLARTSLNYLAV
jgi:hypothetical protein